MPSQAPQETAACISCRRCAASASAPVCLSFLSMFSVPSPAKAPRSNTLAAMHEAAKAAEMRDEGVANTESRARSFALDTHDASPGHIASQEWPATEW